MPVTLPDRIMLATGWRRLALAFLAGALSALAMPPFGVWPLLALTLPVLVLLIDGAAIAGGRGYWGAFTAGWWFGFGYLVVGLWWIGEAFLVQADAFAWMIPFAILGLPAYLAIHVGLGCVLARALWSEGPWRILALAAGLAAADWLRGIALTGFPWNSFGYALANNLELAQAASLFGLWGLSLITVAVLASPVTLLAVRSSKRVRCIPPLIGVLVLAGMWGFGAWRLADTEVGTVPGVKLRIMQPDLPQDQKFRYDARQTVVDLYLKTSVEQGGLAGVTHLFWPESAFPFFLEREPDVLLRIADLLPPGAVLVTGAARAAPPDPGRTGAKVYNSLRAIGSDGAILATADKVHLVPFGEYLPFQPLLESLGIEQLTRVRGGFAAATERHAFAIPGLPNAAPLICYEAIFPGNVLPVDGPRPGFLLNASNDAWFGLTPGPHQHFEQARLRAVEEGLPLVRATNNGISAIVDPVGRITGLLPLGVRGVLDGALPTALPATFYGTWGNSVPLLMIILTIALAFTMRCTDTRRS
ncbi:apolipoprotein N-acyltransferase [Starkeya sp. ORNL1]|uniref:apolipoprotein N-acyltransferase n=1 Tax=Starkeya sp. ORNL1 TaxID=2709380 RepID=UPI001473CB0B|nr:apolipoprotein N-acyltransferase [Starkeya sp. ORNL1]